MLAKNARKLVGKAKWRHLGRSEKALDCGGLVVLAFKMSGIDVKDLKNYGREPHKNGLRDILIANLGEPISKNEMKENDIVLIQWDDMNEPSHVAIVGNYDGRLTLIHSYSHASGVVEHGLDENWIRRIKEVYRWRS